MKNICLLLLLPGFAGAQVFQYNPRFLQTCWQGHVFTSQDPFLSLDHPAVLADMTDVSFGVKSEKFPGMSTAGNLQAVFFFPFESWKISTWYDAWKGAGLDRQEFGLNLARNIGQSDIGIQFNRQELSAIGLGKDALVSGRIEWWWKLNSQLGAGISIHHPFGARFLKLNYEKPAFAKEFCMAWKVSPSCSANFQVVKEEGRRFDLLPGVQFQAEKSFIIRAALSTATSQPTVFSSWHWNKILIGTSVRFHHQIGVQSGLVFLYYPNGFQSNPTKL